MTEPKKDSLSDTSVGRIADEVTAKLKAARKTPVQRASEAIAGVADTERPRSGYALIALAVTIVSVELGRYWVLQHPLHWPPEAIAFVIGFVGFYIINPKRTRDGAAFLLRGAVTLIGALRPFKKSPPPPPAND